MGKYEETNNWTHSWSWITEESERSFTQLSGLGGGRGGGKGGREREYSSISTGIPSKYAFQ